MSDKSEIIRPDVRSFIQMRNVKDGETDRPDDYLPGTNPFGEPTRKKKEPPKKAWTPYTGENSRPDDFVGRAPAKRSWKIKEVKQPVVEKEEEKPAQSQPKKRFSYQAKQRTKSHPEPEKRTTWHQTEAPETTSSPPESPSCDETRSDVHKPECHEKPKRLSTSRPPKSSEPESVEPEEKHHDDPTLGEAAPEVNQVVSPVDDTPTSRSEREPEPEPEPESDPEPLETGANDQKEDTGGNEETEATPESEAPQQVPTTENEKTTIADETQPENENVEENTDKEDTNKSEQHLESTKGCHDTSDTEIHRPDVRSFILMRDVKEGETDRPDDYLPGTNPFGEPTRKKKEQKKKWTPRPANDDSRPDEWMGSGGKVKRSWKIKS